MSIFILNEISGFAPKSSNRVRCQYKSGKRQGKAPIELLTGQAFETDWVDLLLQQVGEGHHAALGTSQPFSMPLALVPNRSSLPILEKGEQFPRVICIFALLCSHYNIG